MNLRHALASLAALWLLVSCPAPTLVQNSKSDSLVLHFSGPGRTVGVDWINLIDTYQVKLTRQGDGTIVTGSTNPGETSLVVAGVYPGTWDVLAEGLDDNGIVVASKTTAVTLPSASISLTVEPLAGTGGFSFKLRFLASEQITVVHGQLYTLAGTPFGSAFHFETADFGTEASYRTVTFAESGLAKGAYRLSLSLQRSGGVPARYLSEAINIAGGVVADHWIGSDGTVKISRDLSPADFASTNTEISALALTSTNLAQRTDGSPYVFDDSVSLYDLKVSSIDATQPLAFTATEAMPGQTLEYALEGSTYTGALPTTWTKVTSGSPVTATLTPGDSQLWFRITAADGLTKGYYALALQKTILASSLTLVADMGTTLPSNGAKHIDAVFGNSPTDTNVVFTSSDPTVATVAWDSLTSRYWIIASKVGTTVITATHADGLSNSLTITVVPGFEETQSLDRGSWTTDRKVPSGTLAVAGNSTLLYALTNGQILRFQSGVWIPYSTVSSSFEFLAVAPDGSLYAGDPTANEVYRFTGVWEPLDGSLTALAGIAVDREGQLYVADNGMLKVRSQGLWNSLGPLPAGFQALGGGDSITALDSDLNNPGTLWTWEAKRWGATSTVPAGTVATTWSQGQKILRKY